MDDFSINKRWQFLSENGLLTFINANCLKRTTIEDLIHPVGSRSPTDPEIKEIYDYLCNALEKHIPKFSSINGFRSSYVCEMLFTFFNLNLKDSRLKKPYFDKVLLNEMIRESEVRVGLEMLAFTICIKLDSI